MPERSWRVTFIVATVLIALPVLFHMLLAVRLGFVERRFNLDFLFIALLGVVIAGGRPRLAVALVIVLLAASLTVQLILGIGAIYIVDPNLMSAYMRFIPFWPWRMIMPIALAGVVLLCILYALLRRTRLERAHRWPLAVALGVVLVGATVTRSNAGFAMVGQKVGTSGLWSGAKLARAAANTRQFSFQPIPAPMTVADVISRRSLPPRIVTVAVESYGVMRDANASTVILDGLHQSLGDQYTIRATTHPSHGATLAGEFRELCNVAIVGTPSSGSVAPVAAGCLGNRLRSKGYATIGVHGGAGPFYNRTVLYPAIGLEATRFGEHTSPADRCVGLMFEGMCDRAAMRIGLAFLNRPGPTYAHIMTLNTHLPLAPTSLGDARCGAVPRLIDGDLCLYVNQMRATLAIIGREVLAAPVPPDLIVLFGDHPPPFIDAIDRAAFVPARVPYITIERRLTNMGLGK